MVRAGVVGDADGCSGGGGAGIGGGGKDDG